MLSTPKRARIASVLCLLALALSITSFIGLQSAEAFERRGREQGFPLPIFGAETLRLGVNVSLAQYDDATLDARLHDLTMRGVRYVRQEFRWSEIEPRKGQFNWASSDRILSATARHGMQVLPVLWTTPEWARISSASTAAPSTETAPPKDVHDFANFVRAFAKRYDARRLTFVASTNVKRQTSNGSGVVGYQIWDEPNLSAAWGDALIDPTRYLQLVRAARAAIREVSQNAPIVLAALAPTMEQSDVNLAPQAYLRKLYQLGGHQAFDIAAAKPYGFAFPPNDRRVEPNVLNFSHIVLMREVMVAHGEGHKAIWATSLGWNALPLDWQGEASVWDGVTETAQAQYAQQAVARAAREWPWLGAMFIENLQPNPRAKDPMADPRWGFSLLTQDGAPRAVMDALTRAVKDAAQAPRAQLFAQCQSPQSVFRSLHLDDPSTAMPEVLSSQPDCRAPNPLAQFTEGWRFDQLGADIPDVPNAKVILRFHGDALALIVRRGNYRAYTFVTIDGQPANALPHEDRGAYLIMTSPGLYPVIETVPVARGLGPGEHVAEITVDRGWNQWALVGWSASGEWGMGSGEWAALRAVAVAVGVLGLIGLVWAWPRAKWREAFANVIARGRRPSADAATLTSAGIVAALAYWLTAGLTWAQDAATAYRNLGIAPSVVLPSLTAAIAFWSPLMVVSLIALAALFVLVLIRLDVGLTLLAFFIPFYLLPQRLFERSFSMVELLTIMCAISWAVRFAISNIRSTIAQCAHPLSIVNLKSKITLFDVSVVALVIVALLSSLQAQFRTEALREWRTVILEPALVYLMLRALKPSPPQGEEQWVRGLSPIITAYLAGALVVACIGLINYAQGITFAAEFGLPRIKSVYNSANNDALYLERALMMLIGLVVIGGGWKVKRGATAHPITLPAPLSTFFAYAALIALALAVLISQSRGALLLGVPVGLVTMLILAGGRWRWAGLGLLALGGIAVGAIASGVLTPLLESTRFARITNVFDMQNGTGFFRLNLWQSALAMWRDHLLLGVGPDNFLYAYRSFYIFPAAWQEPNLSHPHNILLDFASRLGTLGLIVGLGLVIGYGQLAKSAMRASRPLAIGCAGFLAAMLGHGLVDHSFFLVDLAFAFMLTAGLMTTDLRFQISD